MNFGQKASINAIGQRDSNNALATPMKDEIVESYKKIEVFNKKRHTENIKDLAGFQSLFKDFHASGTKGSTSNQNIIG